MMFLTFNVVLFTNSMGVNNDYCEGMSLCIICPYNKVISCGSSAKKKDVFSTCISQTNWPANQSACILC